MADWEGWTMPNKKQLSKVVHVFCEGDTEYHYFNVLKRIEHLGFSLKPVDVCGGGYSKMLDAIKKSSPFGVLARVVLLDFDRYVSIISERAVFDEIVNYINSQNKKGIATFFIVSNPDFDDFVLLHDLKYSFSNKTTILKNNGYKSINELKADDNVFLKFNSDPKNYNNALNRINPRHILDNIFKYDKTNVLFKNTILVNINNQSIKSSNVIDLFEIINCLRQ